MKTITRAANSGFCFGVKQALDKAEEAVENNKKGRKLYTCGQLIHNKTVTDKLYAQGIDVIEKPQEAERGAQVIVRSHGEPPEFYQAAEERELEIIDATCPFVARIHELVRNACDEKYNVVIVGDKDHPEVIGINGWCDNNAIIVNSKEEALDVSCDDLFIVAQTTIQKITFEEVTETLRGKNKRIKLNNTICSATEERQRSCSDISSKVDMMVIVGDKKSSNTQKLYEISKKNCLKTFFVENIEDLPLKEIEKCNKIGIAAGASTPESAIKEVIANMSDKITENNEMNMHDYMEEIEKSLRLPRGGEIVTGKVHQVTDKEIIVNLGCKKDGIIPKDEISMEGDQKLTELFKVDDEIQAKVIKTDDGDGSILLSRKKLEVSEHWNEIADAFENKTLIDVKVVKQVNGGVIAVYKEVSGFIPLSQLSDRFVENSEEFVGQTLTVRISRVDQRRGKAVFSHKAFLNEEKQKVIEEVWNNLHEDDVVEGTVMRFTDYGAFVDIGGIDGLLHISEISWGKLKHPQEVLSIGEKIQVKVLSMNSEKGKISLGLKQTQPEPWSIIDEKYETGQVVVGKVVQIKEYGSFVELEPGLDGLVHISEIKHKRVTNIGDELSVGQIVNAKILEIDKDRKRISLSIKETIDPADEAAEEEAKAAEAEADAEAAAADAEAAAAEEVKAEAPVEEEKAEAPAEEAEAAPVEVEAEEAAEPVADEAASEASEAAPEEAEAVEEVEETAEAVEESAEEAEEEPETEEAEAEETEEDKEA